MRSSIVEFLNQNGLFVRKGDSTRQLTHLLLDGAHGGKLSVPDLMVDPFFEAISADLKKKIPVYVVERKSDVFKLHFDFDLKECIEGSALESMITTVRSAVLKYYPSVGDSRMIVCFPSDDHHVRKGNGVHFYFPFIYVDEEDCLWVRNGVVSDLHVKMPSLAWDSIVDVAVCTSSTGIRLLGSDKVRDCVECKNDKDNKQFCGTCQRVGRVPEGKVYWPFYVYPRGEAESADMMKNMKDNLFYAIRLCSTRLQAGVPKMEITLPPGAPPPSMKKKVKGVSEKDYKLIYGKDGMLKNEVKLTAAALSPDACKSLKDAVNSFHHMYKDIIVKEVKIAETRKRKTSYVIKVFGSGSRFCLNKNADHKTSTVYFILNQNGLQQKCFCKKADERLSGLCSEFTSEARQVDDELYVQLFSDSPGADIHCGSAEMALKHLRAMFVDKPIPPKLTKRPFDFL